MRSSATVLILISFFFAKFARSQSNELIIQGVTGKLYLEHTVVAKETWYSIGRLYNVSPKELAPFNHTTLGKPISIGETIQIPLTATNFSQNGLKGPGETLVPVIHITQEKEWMYRISVNHNKVPIASIEKWNNVTPDQIHPGLHLIVGYLKVKTALSALATNATTPEPVAAVKKPAIDSPAKTTTPPPATTSTPPTTQSNTKAESNTTTQTTTTPPPVTPPPATTTPATPPPTTTPPHFNGGAFRADFTDGGRSASGQAGIFKSNSGWQDGKYYALMNNATVGTIARITDASTGKTVYAKILGQLPDMKESAGLTIRMSNAAAAELGEGGDGRFTVQISY